MVGLHPEEEKRLRKALEDVKSSMGDSYVDAPVVVTSSVPAPPGTVRWASANVEKNLIRLNRGAILNLPESELAGILKHENTHLKIKGGSEEEVEKILSKMSHNTRLKCRKCGHVWTTKYGVIPTRCPSCRRTLGGR